MSSRKTNNPARRKNRVWIVALLAVMTTLSLRPRSTAQALQKGISVELVRTSSAVPVPDADNQDALIVTVTNEGKLYLGIDPVTSDTLAEKLKGRLADRTGNLYIKADARAPYASVVKIFDAARTAGVADVTLLTTQPKATRAGTVVPPEGIEVELVRRSPPATK